MKLIQHAGNPATCTVGRTTRFFKAALYLLGCVILFGGVVSSAQAQKIDPRNDIAESISMPYSIEETGSAPAADAAVPGTLAGVNLEALTPKQWKDLRRQQLRALEAEDDRTWTTAAQNIIYLSTFYGNDVNFRRASGRLYEIYLLDRDEQHRILALAALHAIGSPIAMAHLSQRVRLESSPQVRYLTLAVLQDYYNGIR